MKEPSSKFKKQSSKIASNKNSGKASKDKKSKEIPAPLTSSGKSMGFSTNINSIQSTQTIRRYIDDEQQLASSRSNENSEE
jgi:hypothetical protein